MESVNSKIKAIMNHIFNILWIEITILFETTGILIYDGSKNKQDFFSALLAHQIDSQRKHLKFCDKWFKKNMHNGLKKYFWFAYFPSCNHIPRT